jgi:hypothetical protein
VASGSATATVVAPPPSPARATPTATPTAGPPPKNSPEPGGSVALSNGDNNTSITVHVGTSVVVSLSPSPSYRWSEPASSNGAALGQTGGAANPDGSATGSFMATSPGQAQLSAVENANCYPQCLPPSRLWRVMVTVVP